MYLNTSFRNKKMHIFLNVNLLKVSYLLVSGRSTFLNILFGLHNPITSKRLFTYDFVEINCRKDCTLCG